MAGVAARNRDVGSETMRTLTREWGWVTNLCLILAGGLGRSLWVVLLPYRSLDIVSPPPEHHSLVMELSGCHWWQVSLAFLNIFSSRSQVYSLFFPRNQSIKPFSTRFLFSLLSLSLVFVFGPSAASLPQWK